MTKNVVILCLRINQEDAERVREIAEKKRCTMAAVVREAIGKALDTGLLI